MKQALLLLFATCAIFTTSCSSLRIEKRHYKSGFYVNVNGAKSHDNVRIAAAADETENNAAAHPAAEPENDAEVVRPSSVSQPEPLCLKTQETGRVKSQTHSIPDIRTAPAAAEQVRSSERNTIATAADDEEPTAADDTETILLVILAILLPPLAVYMKEGVTTRFWVDLICWLLGGGFFFTPFFYGGGLWLFAVVFALLIVLDII